MPTPTKILITGAAGRIGTMLRPQLRAEGRILRLLDISAVTDLDDCEEFLQASVTDPDAMSEACREVDAIIHLGGEAGESTWSHIAEVNIGGTYTVFEAARRQGVKRVIFASSNHAVGYYPRTNAPAGDYVFPAPDTYYGVSKVTGEALASLYNSRYGMDTICIRILTCVEKPTDLRMLSTWLSPEDAGRLFEACLSVTAPGFRIIWGVSANTRGWFSLDEAHSLGYHPQDNAEKYAAQLIKEFGEPDLTQIDHRTIGGGFCSADFDAEADRSGITSMNSPATPRPQTQPSSSHTEWR